MERKWNNYFYYHYYYSIRVFHISNSWWFFIEVWMTDSLPKFLGHFSLWNNLNNIVVWMVSTCPLIFKSSSPFTKPLRIVPIAPITISITILACSKSCAFFPNFYHSFSLPSLHRVTPKITEMCMFMVFSSPVSLYFWIEWLLSLLYIFLAKFSLLV